MSKKHIKKGLTSLEITAKEIGNKKFCGECKLWMDKQDIIQPDGEEESVIGICKECAKERYNN